MTTIPPPSVPDHEMISVIGEGSYGQVWRARSTLGTMRAVKVVWRAKFDSSRPYEREFSGIKRFEPVSRSHEGLVDILQVGRNDEAGFFYYVMELADDAGGEEGYRPRTLRSEIDHRGRLPAGDCVDLFLSLAAALGHMHRLGLIHRDVKPSNIIIVDGVAKLADIGLVAEMSESRSFVGTEGYIPPEGPNSAQADIYSLGKALYEAATGLDRMKFPSLPASGPDGLAGISGMMDINVVAMKACMPEAAGRYQSGAEMLVDLATIQSGRSVRDVHRAAERLKFARRWGLGAALVAVAAAGVGVMAMWRVNAERESRRWAEVLLKRAETAEGESRERFFGQSVALARAECLSSQTGHRFRALEALREAARLHPGDPALRSQAMTALAIPDFREIRRWPAMCRADGLPLRQAMAPAMDRYASVTPDNSIVIRSTEGAAGETRLSVQTAVVGTMVFSPDGAHLLAVPQESGSDAVIWDTTTAEECLRIPAEVARKAHGGIHFRDSGREVVLQQDAAVLVIPLDGSAPRTIALPSRKDVLSAVCADRVLAGSMSNGRVYLVNLVTNSLEFTLPPFASSFAFRLSPDARTAAVSGEGLVTLHDLTGFSSEAAQMPGRQGAVVMLAFDPAGEVLFSGSWDGTMRLFGRADRTLLATMPSPVAGDIMFCRNGRLVFTDSVRLDLVEAEWAGREACRVLRLPRNPLSNRMIFAAGGRLLLSTGEAGVEVSDAGTLRPLVTLPSPLVRECAMPLERGPLYAATTGGLFRRAVEYKPDGHFVFGPAEHLLPGDAWSVAASSDGSTVVAMAGWQIFTSRGGGEFTLLMDAPEQFRSLALSPDGRWLSTRGARLKVFDLKSQQPHQPVVDLSGAGISLVSFTADSRSLVVSSTNGVRCQALVDGAVAWECTEHSAGQIAACSPDGRLVAVQDSGTSFLLLRPSDGQLVARVAHHLDGAVCSLGFSPDSRRLLVTESNNIARIWDLPVVRSQLAPMQLDWDDPPYPPAVPLTPVSAACSGAGDGKMMENPGKPSGETSEQQAQ